MESPIFKIRGKQLLKMSLAETSRHVHEVYPDAVKVAKVGPYPYGVGKGNTYPGSRNHL